jgi:zinc-ribbon domain
MATCQTCSAELDPEWKFCTSCGTPTPVTTRALRQGRGQGWDNPGASMPISARIVQTPVGLGATGGRGRTGGRARTSSRTSTNTRDSRRLMSLRRTLIAAIAVLLGIAAVTGLILYFASHA